MEFQGFPRLMSIFYAIFDVKRGPILIYDVPEGSIGVDFESISPYIIPKPGLWGKLVTISAGEYKVMGFPVAIGNKYNKRYDRNTFIFNVCFVFERAAETSSYESVVRKLAMFLTNLENDKQYLSKTDSTNALPVRDLIEQLYEDLNSYCECQIAVDASNTINLKLFPTYPNPPPVYNYQVPVLTVNLMQLWDVNWDITMLKIAKHINGINHIRRIAESADVDVVYARKCVEHLVYYGCAILVDIFQFGNIYAVKPDIIRMIQEDTILQGECLSYVTKPDMPAPPIARIFELYCALQHGLTLKKWIEDHKVFDLPIDIRRFISFGVIKGFLYRVHKYPVLSPNCPVNVRSMISSNLQKLLDGKHHYDDICTETGLSPRELDNILGFTESGDDKDSKNGVIFIYK